MRITEIKKHYWCLIYKIMGIALKILFDGRNVDDIFRLPCIKSIEKGEKGKAYATLFPHFTEGRQTAQIGDVLVQYKTGKWQVFGKEAFDRI